MAYLLSAALLYAAVAILLLAHPLIERPSAPRWIAGDGFASFLALTLTCLIGSGVTALADGVFEEWRAISAAKAIAVIAVVVAAGVATERLLKGFLGGGRSLDPRDRPLRTACATPASRPVALHKDAA